MKESVRLSGAWEEVVTLLQCEFIYSHGTNHGAFCNNYFTTRLPDLPFFIDVDKNRKIPEPRSIQYVPYVLQHNKESIVYATNWKQKDKGTKPLIHEKYSNDDYAIPLTKPLILQHWQVMYVAPTNIEIKDEDPRYNRHTKYKLTKPLILQHWQVVYIAPTNIEIKDENPKYKQSLAHIANNEIFILYWINLIWIYWRLHLFTDCRRDDLVIEAQNSLLLFYLTIHWKQVRSGELLQLPESEQEQR